MAFPHAPAKRDIRNRAFCTNCLKTMSERPGICRQHWQMAVLNEDSLGCQSLVGLLLFSEHIPLHTPPARRRLLPLSPEITPFKITSFKGEFIYLGNKYASSYFTHVKANNRGHLLTKLVLK